MPAKRYDCTLPYFNGEIREKNDESGFSGENWKSVQKILLTFLYFISNEMMILLDQVPEKMKIWERRVNWIDFYLIHFKIRQTEKHKKILFKSMTIFPALFQTIFLIFFLFSQAICTVNSKL